MDATVLQQFRLNLLEQRKNLTSWLQRTPARQKEIRLGPSNEAAVQTRLLVLDEAIEKAETGSLGLCEVCHEGVETGLLAMDYTCCVCLAHLSGPERAELEFELELATKVQLALLPQQEPEIPGVEVAAFSRPAAIVGGDYFDFYRFRDGGYGVAIGDVAGHGMSASLLMANLQASLRILVPDHDSPGVVMRRLNQLFYHNVRMTNFVTLFLAHYDPATYRMTYCSAGHNPPLLVRQRSNGNEPLSWLKPTGAAIGLVEETDFGTVTVTISPGDLLLLYTDGISEALNPHGEEFGAEKLARLVQDASALPAQRLVQELRARLQLFSEGQPLRDDTTIVALKIKDSHHEPDANR